MVLIMRWNCTVATYDNVALDECMADLWLAEHALADNQSGIT